MEAIKQGGIETITGGQRARMSSWRISFIGGAALASFYVVWGIVKIIS